MTSTVYTGSSPGSLRLSLIVSIAHEKLFENQQKSLPTEDIKSNMTVVISILEVVPGYSEHVQWTPTSSLYYLIVLQYPTNYP